jgi:hypothetical protein
MDREPEIHEPIVTTHALVPAEPRRPGRVAGWLQRVTGAFTARPSEPSSVPPRLNGLPPRVDALERRLEAHVEETLKRLEESEGRVQHRTQQRFEALRSELEISLRATIAKEVGDQTDSLRRWLVASILIALVAGAIAAFALVQVISRSGA